MSLLIFVGIYFAGIVSMILYLAVNETEPTSEHYISLCWDEIRMCCFLSFMWPIVLIMILHEKYEPKWEAFWSDFEFKFNLFKKPRKMIVKNGKLVEFSGAQELHVEGKTKEEGEAEHKKWRAKQPC